MVSENLVGVFRYIDNGQYCNDAKDGFTEEDELEFAAENQISSTSPGCFHQDALELT